jgi:hypothetical protein
MSQRFIVRLLNSEGVLLSWCEVMGEARPAGRPLPTPFVARVPSMFVIERDGIASQVVIHWADLDLVRVSPLTPARVQIGQVLRFDWIEPVWMVEGSKVDVPLPSVTVRRAVQIAPPTGNLGAVGTV